MTNKHNTTSLRNDVHQNTGQTYPQHSKCSTTVANIHIDHITLETLIDILPTPIPAASSFSPCADTQRQRKEDTQMDTHAEWEMNSTPPRLPYH